MTSQQLMSMAPAKGITRPGELNPVMQQQLSMLSAASRTFDRTYVADQVAGHRVAVANMQSKAIGGTDPDLKAFSQATLPIVQEHMRMALRVR